MKPQTLLAADLADYLVHSFERDHFTVTVPDFMQNVKSYVIDDKDPKYYTIEVLKDNDL